MHDPRVENLAKILVNYSVKVKPGDWVLINANVQALPLAREVLRQVLRAEGRPTLEFDDDEAGEIFYKEASDEVLEWISPIDTKLFEEVDVIINLRAATNTRQLSQVDPQRQSRRQKSRRRLFETFMRRAAEGSLRWVLTEFPCPALAQDADMSLREFEDFVYAATYADQPDPVQAWQRVFAEQERLVNWLRGKEQVVLRGPNVDLTLSVRGRAFINCAGDKNMPDGEIFTGPVEDSANGWVRFTYPAIYGGREVEGVELEFKDGQVVNAHAKKNEAFLLSMLDTDAGARYIGEFAIGTNYAIQRFTRRILYDEKIGGSFHLALGAGYPETGSRNQSAIHWDFICDLRQDSQILVDGELFYKDGAFVV